VNWTLNCVKKFIKVFRDVIDGYPAGPTRNLVSGAFTCFDREHKGDAKLTAPPPEVADAGIGAAVRRNRQYYCAVAASRRARMLDAKSGLAGSKLATRMVGSPNVSCSALRHCRWMALSALARATK